MAERRMITVDGNEAVASVAHRTSEVIAIYPITPSSPMGEISDAWSAQGRKNIWGTVPKVIEMQSEAGAAGAVHGSLQSGALTTTFTASQGLLLMIPNMYKIAGELSPFCMHVSARTVATHALSIFGDHSDVMACRQTGFAMTASGSGQEAHDMAAISTAATLRARVPFLHFFDGFRTSHEVTKFEEMTNEDLLALMDEDKIADIRRRALSPDHPVVRGTAQNPDTFFQMQEARNPYHLATPGIVQAVMDQFASVVGRRYKLFDYYGHPEAERVIIIMGSGAETVHEVVKCMAAKGEKVGLVKVRLYRPFSVDHFIAALPTSVRKIAVLDRTKEHGALGEPLYLDVVAALAEAKLSGLRAAGVDPVVIGGRYGLSSKEFTPGMVKAVYDELTKSQPKLHFTVGIIDDVTNLSLKYDPKFRTLPASTKQAVFFGLGSDGTVGANKNSIKIIADNTDFNAQGYFVYDSKKAGAMTISHLRFGSDPLQCPYLVDEAEFVACHQFSFVEKVDFLKYAKPGATVLLNSPFDQTKIWDKLPASLQRDMIAKKVKFFVIDADHVAQENGMGRRINTIMQTCYFAISGVLPRDEAIAQIKKAIKKTYGNKGQEIVDLNFKAVDATLANLHEVKLPAQVSSNFDRPSAVPDEAPDFVKAVTAMMMKGEGDVIPVSAFPADGTWPVGTTRWEKRNIALEIPVWEQELCIQCNKCALVCPHAAIRMKVYSPAELKNAPATFKTMPYKGKEFGEALYTIQVAPEDCTGCTLCMEACIGVDKKNPERKALKMQPQMPLRENERENWDYFLKLPEVDRSKLKPNVKMVQFAEPLFEFSGACAACGETPYVKLITQMFGDRTMIANTTGCSSIYGGNLPTTPYRANCDGRGPAWANSLFEDNAEFGLGFRLAVDKFCEQARELVEELKNDIGQDVVKEIIAASQAEETGIFAQRDRITKLKEKLLQLDTPRAKWLAEIADYLAKKSVWIVGGDGWAYDIGYGGVDHVMASGHNVNILVLDTEVYSNTGGQASKATGLAAAAKFATAGKGQPKKDLGLMGIAYGNVYVASVALGAKDAQTVRAFAEAESYDGASLIIAYSPCNEHGFTLATGLDHQKLAVETGYWPLYRYDPRRLGTGEPALVLDSKPTRPLTDFLDAENRFRQVARRDPERYAQLVKFAEEDQRRRRAVYEKLAELSIGPTKAEAAE
jgi:pyruvate-ferredoxin/flavodoxin oxidoreductase